MSVKWILFQVFSLLVGIGIGAALIFHVMFLYRVLPHGGLW